MTLLRSKFVRECAPPRRSVFAGFVSLALAASFAWATSATAAPPPFRLPLPVVRTLPNGLTVAVFRDTRLPLARVQLTVVAGSGTEQRLPAGVAYVTSQLVGLSTASRDANAVQEDFERAGGRMSTRIGRDVGTLSGTFLATELPRALELVADVATHALFTDQDFTRVRRIARAQVMGPVGIARQPENRLWTAAFGDRGYGHAPGGTAESLDRMTIADVRSFYNTRWGPKGAMLAIAGDVDPDQVQTLVSEAFGNWSARAVEAVADAAPATPARSMTVVHRNDANECEVWLGVPGPRAGEPDEIAIAIASQLVARAAGRAGAVRAGQSALRQGGFVWLAATTSVDSAAIVARRLEGSFASLRAARPQLPELESLKHGIQASFPMRFETLDGLCDQWSSEAALGLGFDKLVAFPAEVQAVTAAQVAAAARKWFDPARMCFVVTGPSERLRKPLGAVAPVAHSEGTDEPVTPALEKAGRERIARALVAHGTLGALHKIRDSVLEATATLRLGSNEAKATIVQMRKEPERMIYDLKLKERGTRDVLVGLKAWRSPIDTLTIVQDADTATVSALRQGFRSDVIHLLLDAADPKSRVASRGSIVRDGVNLERVEVWTALGSHRTMFLDPVTHLLTGVELQDTDDLEGNAAVRRWYADYREVDGIRLPFDEQRWLGAQRVMQLKLTRYALNSGVADALFVHPEAPLPPTSR